MAKKKKMYCCGCASIVSARKTLGKEIYPHRKDLWAKTMYKCDACNNYAGDTASSIPTPGIRAMRLKIHNIIDPLWRTGRIKRGEVYREMKEMMGYTYHNGELKDEAEGARAMECALVLQAKVRESIKRELK